MTKTNLYLVFLTFILLVYAILFYTFRPTNPTKDRAHHRFDWSHLPNDTFYPLYIGPAVSSTCPDNTFAPLPTAFTLTYPTTLPDRRRTSWIFVKSDGYQFHATNVHPNTDRPVLGGLYRHPDRAGGNVLYLRGGEYYTIEAAYVHDADGTLFGAYKEDTNMLEDLRLASMQDLQHSGVITNICSGAEC